MANRLQIPEDIVQAMIRQARAELPNECCGLLAGTLEDRSASNIGRVTLALPLVNKAASPVEYLSEERSMLAADKEMRRLGLDLLAVYHSHPASPPVPSRKDLERNYLGDVIHVIIGLAQKEPCMRCWILGSKDYHEVEYELMETTSNQIADGVH